MMQLWRALIGRRYAVYHRVPKRKRRGAKQPCSAVAFYRRVRGPIPANEIPVLCLTCGQPIQQCHLDLHEVVDMGPIQPHVEPPRPRRHFGPKGVPVVER